MRIKPKIITRVIVAAAMMTTATLPLNASSLGNSKEEAKQLDNGEVIVGLKKEGSTRYVIGKILIDAPPEKVWPIMVNPFEFLGKISPRMKRVEVLEDKPNFSVLKITLDMSILMPNFTYVVDSDYSNCERITFHRTAGALKEFKGTWDIHPVGDGTRTELDYAAYVDPGFFVPQWLIREGLKNELPQILKTLRDRAEEVNNAHQPLARRTILAASVQQEHTAIRETQKSY